MPRGSRGLEDGLIYHVLNRGNKRNRVFYNYQDYFSFKDTMKEANKRYPLNIFAYCLMPNHFHIILQSEKACNLVVWMQWLMIKFVRNYHQRNKSNGHIWQGRYKSFPIQNEQYLLNALRYVEGNPVRACIVKSALHWRWSSHKDRKSLSAIFNSKELPLELPDDWTELVNTPITAKEQDKLLKSIERQAPYGEKEWQKQICKKLRLEHTINPIGRPRK